MSPAILQSRDELPQHIRVSDPLRIVSTSNREKSSFQSRVRGVSTSGLIIETPVSPQGEALPVQGKKVKVNLYGEEHEIAFTSVLRQLQTRGEKLYSLALPQRYRLSRRKFVRLQVDTEIAFRKLLSPRKAQRKASLGRPANARLLNLCKGGMLFETSRQLRVGEFLLLNLDLSLGGKLQNLLGRVKRVERLCGGGRLVGIQFCKGSDLAPRLAEQLSDLAPHGISDLTCRIRDLVSELLRPQQGQISRIEML